MKIENCIICDTLVPELERQLDKQKADLLKAFKLLAEATDEGKTWNNQTRLNFLKQIADLKKQAL